MNGMRQQPIVLPQDVVLPEQITLKVYHLKEPTEKYCISEQSARDHVSTHKKCEKCGTIYEKRSFCKVCSDHFLSDQYLKKPFKEWDGVTPLVIYRDDTFFYSSDEIEDYCASNEVNACDLNLIICEPNMCPTISHEMFMEELPENKEELKDFSKELVKRIDEFNDFVKTLPVMSYSAGAFRTEYLFDQTEEQ